ncbi:MAG: sugar nucleotide-binding protein [Lachnospiraceae bacterium]|nr:sugar nucleotide-binding protein [Lachnospiraceae bacterium]
MTEKILILGVSGFVGTAIYEQLSQSNKFDVYGTFFSLKSNAPHMCYFSLENPEKIKDILARIAPDIVISALRGDFKKQMDVHIFTAEYLKKNHGRLIYFSTANVFDGKQECPHYEGDSLQSDSEYGKFKISCENKLREIMGNSAIILRIPFVYGKNSVRMHQIEDGCQKGIMDVYDNLFSNYVTDIQIADYVEWIISEEKEGTFHIGTTDVMRYSDFIMRLIKDSGKAFPTFNYLDVTGTMAVLTERKDIPYRLLWNVDRVISFLCSND